MNMLLMLLLIAAIVFVVYAVATQYKSTDATLSAPKRVWAAIIAAGISLGGAIGAYLTQWVNQ